MSNLETPQKPRYDFTIHTFGCKVNTYDTGLLQKRFESLGHRAVTTEAKGIEAFGLGARTPRIHILNTCAVTAEATKEAAKLARRIKSKDPFSTIVVTGCGAQVDGEVFDALPVADLVVANSHKGHLERLLDQHFKGELEAKVHRSNIFRKDDLEAGGGTELGHTRAFLKIQDGCNSFCTYCVIPFARGKSRSIPVAEIIKRIKELHAQGANEVVLTGVHIGDYEDKLKSGEKLWLHDLVKAVLEKTEIPRIRLSSLEPVELTPEVLALYKNERMCPHFHMSIQSANTRVLGAMKRKYEASHVEEALRAIQEHVPGAFVGMDVIVGFPGETDEEFTDTYERLASLPWTRIHVFPYSERPGTKAAAYEGSVARDERLRRSQHLRALSTSRMREMAKLQVGLEKTVLVLKNQGGLTTDYWPVKLIGDEEALEKVIGKEIKVRIESYDDQQTSRMDGVLVGRAIWEN